MLLKVSVEGHGGQAGLDSQRVSSRDMESGSSNKE